MWQMILGESEGGRCTHGHVTTKEWWFEQFLDILNWSHIGTGSTWMFNAENF